MTCEPGKKVDTKKYKYALEMKASLMPMSYQIKKRPSPFGGIVYLGLAQSRNTPYVPFYGLVNDTYGAFKKSLSAKVRPTSVLGCLAHQTNGHEISDLFGTSIQDKWRKNGSRLDQRTNCFG